VKVYFAADATPQQINTTRAFLERNSQVKSVTFVSKEDALVQMKQRFPDLFKTELPSNPLPDSEEVVPVKGEYTETIARSVQNAHLAGVEKVKYGKKTAHRILSVAHAIEYVFVIAVLILLAAATLLIGNTIRLSIFSRRREIEVMKLVGATNWFVRGPFMLEGLLCGLGGAVAAIVLLLLGKEIALPSILGHINAGSDVHAIGFAWNALALVAAGLLLGAAGSGLTLRRFLRV